MAIAVSIESIPPLLMASVRFLIAGAILYAIMVRRGDREGDRPTRAHWKSAWIIGTALLLGGNGFVVMAEQSVPTGIAALVIASVPLWLAFGDRLVFGQRLSWPAVLGLGIGFAGVALLVGQAAAGNVDPRGLGMLLAASLLWAAGSLYSRRAPLPKRPLVGAGMEMIAGGLSLLVASALSGEFGRLEVSSITFESAAGLAYLIVFGSWVGFTAYVWLLQNASVSLTGTYAFVNPVIAVLLGWAILGEAVTARTLVAGGVIVIGVALIVTARPAKPLPGEVAGGPAVRGRRRWRLRWLRARQPELQP